jgi:uncharacterized protein YdiU (UPF0061 family)
VAHDEEEVGYKRPPKSGQFKPGKSGNPRGRPKGTADFKADLAAEMRQRITLRDKNGRSHKVTKQRALIKLLFSSALQNEKAAITALLACMRYFGAGSEQPVTEIADLEDFDMIRDYVERTEARLKHEKDPDKESKVPKRKARK